MRRTMLVSGFLAVTLFAAALPARAAEKAATDPRRATIDTIRAVGTAIYSWVVDRAGEREAAPVAEGKPAEPPPSYRWSDCPAVSYEEAQKLLVPRYLAELPRNDGWGHPLEVCIDRKGVGKHGHLVFGVRSAGADGRFDGDTYTVGAFDHTLLDHDIVWFDGYFIAWPTPEPKK